MQQERPYKNIRWYGVTMSHPLLCCIEASLFLQFSALSSLHPMFLQWFHSIFHCTNSYFYMCVLYLRSMFTDHTHTWPTALVQHGADFYKKGLSYKHFVQWVVGHLVTVTSYEGTVAMFCTHFRQIRLDVRQQASSSLVFVFCLKVFRVLLVTCN